MVRLVAYDGTTVTTLGQSFNSSMVRLVDPCRSNRGQGTEFQFQYGAIGSELMKRAVQANNLFQFQYGAIGSKH